MLVSRVTKSNLAISNNLKGKIDQSIPITTTYNNDSFKKGDTSFCASRPINDYIWTPNQAVDALMQEIPGVYVTRGIVGKNLNHYYNDLGDFAKQKVDPFGNLIIKGEDSSIGLIPSEIVEFSKKYPQINAIRVVTNNTVQELLLPYAQSDRNGILNIFKNSRALKLEPFAMEMQQTAVPKYYSELVQLMVNEALDKGAKGLKLKIRSFASL